EVVAIGDGFRVLARQVGEQSGAIDAGVLRALGAGHGGDEGRCKGLQAADRAAEGGRRDLTVGEQWLLTGFEARIPNLPPSHPGVTHSGRYGSKSVCVRSILSRQ